MGLGMLWLVGICVEIGDVMVGFVVVCVLVD